MKEISYQLEIDFQNPMDDEIFTLKWNILNEDYAWMWMNELRNLMQHKEPLYSRFTGFNISQEEEDKIFRNLSKAIELINAEGLYKIVEKFQAPFDQKMANRIHHHFEVLYGDVHNPSEVFKASSPLIQSTITKLNHYVHDLESIHRNLENKEAFSAVIVEFLERRQLKLTTEMLKSFSMDIDFGDIVLHYGIIGKSWWEAFLDEDEDIFLSGIRPLNVMSGEFDIHFGEQKLSKDRIHEFYDFLKENEQHPEDPTLSLGHLCVAKLESSLARENIKKKLATHKLLAEIRLYKEEVMLSQYRTLEGDSTHEGFFRMREEETVAQGAGVKLLHLPIQLIPIRGKSAGVTKLSSLPIHNIYENRGHIVSFLGTSDQCPVEFSPSTEYGGLRLSKPIKLYKGDLLHLAYDLEGGYLPVRAKGK